MGGGGRGGGGVGDAPAPEDRRKLRRRERGESGVAYTCLGLKMTRQRTHTYSERSRIFVALRYKSKVDASVSIPKKGEESGDSLSAVLRSSQDESTKEEDEYGSEPLSFEAACGEGADTFVRQEGEEGEEDYDDNRGSSAIGSREELVDGEQVSLKQR